jgi:hypothetical protein
MKLDVVIPLCITVTSIYGIYAIFKRTCCKEIHMIREYDDLTIGQILKYKNINWYMELIKHRDTDPSIDIILKSK